MQRKQKKNFKKNTKANVRQDGANNIRVKGVACDPGNAFTGTGAFQLQRVAISVDPADNFATRLTNISPNFTEWRIRSLTAKVIPRQINTNTLGFDVPPLYSSVVTDPDAALPTTLEGVVDNGGDAGNVYLPFEVRWPKESSQWLKCAVGLTNTDVRFYRAGYFNFAGIFPNTSVFTYDVLYMYDVEFRNPK